MKFLGDRMREPGAHIGAEPVTPRRVGDQRAIAVRRFGVEDGAAGLPRAEPARQGRRDDIEAAADQRLVNGRVNVRIHIGSSGTDPCRPGRRGGIQREAGLEQRHAGRHSGDVPRHRPDGVQAWRQRPDSVQRDPAMSRLEAGDPAERGRYPDGPASVRAIGDVGLVVGDRHRGSAGGAARHPSRVNRVDRSAEVTVHARGAEGEFVQVNLADDADAGGPAGAVQARRVLLGRPGCLGDGAAAGRRGQASHVNEVLDGQPDPGTGRCQPGDEGRHRDNLLAGRDARSPAA